MLSKRVKYYYDFFINFNKFSCDKKKINKTKAKKIYKQLVQKNKKKIILFYLRKF